MLFPEIKNGLKVSLSSWSWNLKNAVYFKVWMSFKSILCKIEIQRKKLFLTSYSIWMTRITSELKEIMNFHINLSWPFLILVSILQPLNMIFRFVQMVHDSRSVGLDVPASALLEIRPAYWISGFHYSWWHERNACKNECLVPGCSLI